MSAGPYRIEECDRIFAEDGSELAVDRDDGNCVLRVSRRGNLGVIVREAMMLGIELGATGMVIGVPIVGVVGSAIQDSL